MSDLATLDGEVAPRSNERGGGGAFRGEAIYDGDVIKRCVVTSSAWESEAGLRCDYIAELNLHSRRKSAYGLLP
jgi:hypothetical protein